jgi:hypothetical protein
MSDSLCCPLTRVVANALTVAVLMARLPQVGRSIVKCPDAVNDPRKRSLALADIPSLLAPSSPSRDDGKRADGLIVLPWASGQCALRDFACPYILTASHLDRAVLRACNVAPDAEIRKLTKYSPPLAVKPLGALGDKAFSFLNDI